MMALTFSLAEVGPVCKGLSRRVAAHAAVTVNQNKKCFEANRKSPREEGKWKKSFGEREGLSIELV